MLCRTKAVNVQILVSPVENDHLRGHNPQYVKDLKLPNKGIKIHLNIKVLTDDLIVFK